MSLVGAIGSFVFAMIVIVGILVTLALIFFLCFFNGAHCARKSSRDHSAYSTRSYYSSGTTHNATSDAGRHNKKASSRTNAYRQKASSGDPIRAEIIEIIDVTPKEQH